MVVADAAIEVSDLHTKFGRKTVHDGLTFSIPKASITALIGGSGSGKSVLFRELLGLLKPSSGTVRVLGESVWELSENKLSALRRRLGVLFQNGALFSGLSVAENIAAPLREWTSLPRATIDDLVTGKLLLSGLTPDVGRKNPSELSGGMIKRAALARALVLEPEIVFLDEPTSGLDPVLARSFDHLVRTLCDGLGITVCMITHDPVSISTITDYVIVLGEGKLLTEGTFAEIRRFEHPWIQSYFTETRSKE